MLCSSCVQEDYVGEGRRGVRHENGEMNAKSKKEGNVCLLVRSETSCYLSDASVRWHRKVWPLLLRFPTQILLYSFSLSWALSGLHINTCFQQVPMNFNLYLHHVFCFLVGPSAMTGLDGIGCILTIEYLFMNYYQKSFQQH